jgi:hypothetical protein
MNNRRRFLLFTAAAALLFVLALPGVHWRLYGWCRGEPFYRGRPSSYWRSAIAACEIRWSFFSLATSGGDRGLLPPVQDMILIPRLDPVERFRQWLAENLNQPNLAAKPVAPFVECDASAVPVLIALLGDRDPQVRCFAAQTLGSLNGDAREAVPALRDLASDRTHVFDDATVGHAAAEAVKSITAPSWTGRKR